MRPLFLFLLLLPALVASGNPVKHIIVLMMENRSFDHFLGWLKTALSPRIDGLTPGMSTPRDPNDLSKGTVEITRDGYDVSPDDPKHDFDNIAVQIGDGSMNGFVYDSIKNGLNETNPVSMFDYRSAPIINSLALEYAVFDKWFCSIPTSTDPNRQFAMSGTSQGTITNFNGTLYTQQSYFDYLRERNRTFAGYYQNDLWALGYFADLLKEENSVFIKELEPNFFDDVATGKLADFTWLQPRLSTIENELPTWQHPDAPVVEGERLIKQLYEAIRAGPKWEETLFLITYDEHGGFYDHVTPPREGVPAPDENIAPNGFRFDQLGVRIPTIAISPWIAKGTIVSDALPGEQPTETSAFDSTSILATANIILGLSEEKPLGDRMAWANTFSGLTTQLSEPRKDCPMKLPELPKAKQDEWIIQRTKPLNEHMVGQLLFYCAMSYPEEHKRGECPGRPEILINQGLASDWIRAQKKLFMKKNKTAK